MLRQYNVLNNQITLNTIQLITSEKYHKNKFKLEGIKKRIDKAMIRAEIHQNTHGNEFLENPAKIQNYPFS